MRNLLAVVLAFSTFVGCANTTSLAKEIERKQLMLVSEEKWNAKSAKAYENLLTQAKTKNLLVIDSRLDQIIQNLKPYTATYREGATNWNWMIRAHLNGEMNAHGFASGKILINTGLYWNLQLNDDELAFVIAHEMAHALREHSREKMSASLLLGSLPTYARHGVSRVWLHEQEADLIALGLMKKAGYKPQAALSFWAKYDVESTRRRALKSPQVFMPKDLLAYRTASIEYFLLQDSLHA